MCFHNGYFPGFSDCIHQLLKKMSSWKTAGFDILADESANDMPEF
jgi:hypothetical protein